MEGPAKLAVIKKDDFSARSFATRRLIPGSHLADTDVETV